MDRLIVHGSLIGEFSVSVDYDRTIEAGVEAGEYYNFASPDISSANFPTDRKGTQEVRMTLLHFKRSVEIEDVTDEMKRQGVRPADLQELLALMEKNMSLLRKTLHSSGVVVVLGSPWHPGGRRRFPCFQFYTYYGGPDLGVSEFENGFNSGCHFLVVKK
jgi:hypothetical protein